jgi:multiple sugar transport system substrate-binding protein
MRLPRGKGVSAGPATGDITVWALGAEGEKLEQIAADFQTKNAGAKVKVTVIPFDAAHDKISTAIAGKQTPDVSLVGHDLAGRVRRHRRTRRNADRPDQAGPVLQGVVGHHGRQGHVVRRPVVHRDPAHLLPQGPRGEGRRDAGAGWSQDDFKAFTKAMQAKGGAKWGISLQPGGKGSWQTMMPFAWQKGANLAQGEKFTFNTPEMQSALDYYASFFTEKISPTDLAQGALETGFIKGDIGAFVSGPWHMGILKDQGGADFAEKWALAPMPKDKEGTSFTGGGDLVVFKNSKNRDARGSSSTS